MASRPGGPGAAGDAGAHLLHRVADAVGSLAIDKVFTGNMTGNVVILGMGAAGADDLPVVGPALSLAGAGRGWSALRGSPRGTPRRAPVLLAAVGLAVAAAAV